MEGREDLDSFLGKWRGRWPEWRVAEAFVPTASRDTTVAWMALRQELADAAWAGADPRPGEAKLGWWVEELHGWERGARRHPLGRVLQPLAAPWPRLAAALPILSEARERQADFAQARDQLQPCARAIVEVSAAIEPGAGVDALEDAAPAVAAALLGQRLLDGDPSSVPLQAHAALGAGADEARLRVEAAALLLRDWPDAAGLSRAARIHLALLHARLVALAADGSFRPVPAWRTLVLSWRAARHSVPQA